MESHFVQPPLSIGGSESDLPSNQADAIATAGASRTHSKSGSTDSRRQFIEKEAYIHSAMQKGTHEGSFQGARSIASTTKSVSPPPQFSRTDTPSKQSFSEGTRGHARDPLEEEAAFLFVGPSTFTGELTADDDKASQDYFTRTSTTGPEDSSLAGDSGDAGYFPSDEMDMVPIVSESPGAADIDIYETAYSEEVERIRKETLAHQGLVPRVYLNRRVEGRTSGLGDLLRHAATDDRSSKQDRPSLSEVVARLSLLPRISGPGNETAAETTASPVAISSPDPSSHIRDLEGGGLATAVPSELAAHSEQTNTFPTSGTPPLSAGTATTAPVVTDTTDATAEIGTTPTTQKSRGGFRSLFGRVRRGGSQFGKGE